MTTVLLVTFAMLFLPKLWGLILLLVRSGQRKAYGGFFRVVISVLLESVFSVLTAPVLMLYQTNFVIAILSRRSTGWFAQQRTDHRLGIKEAFIAHWGQTLVGIVAGVISYHYVPSFFWWFLPVLAGLVFAMPVSILSSSTALGLLAKRLGLFLTPDESEPPPVLDYLRANLSHFSSVEAADGSLEAKIRDPAVCALHISMLPHRLIKKRLRHQLRALTYQVIEEGPVSLSVSEKRALVADPDSLMRLHSLSWSQRDAH
jgi:membrane glycosyltransferase